MQGTWVWSLVRELRCHMLRSSQAGTPQVWARLLCSLRVTSRESVHRQRARMMQRSSHVPAAKLQHSQINKQISVFWKKNLKSDEWHDWDKENRTSWFIKGNINLEGGFSFLNWNIKKINWNIVDLLYWFRVYNIVIHYFSVYTPLNVITR